MTDRHRRLPELSHVLDPTTKETAMNSTYVTIMASGGRATARENNPDDPASDLVVVHLTKYGEVSIQGTLADCQALIDSAAADLADIAAARAVEASA